MILDEVNVQKIQTFDSLDDFDALGEKIIKKKSGNITVALNTEITPELEREGWIRELTRQINNYRKKEGLTIHDKVSFTISSSSEKLLHTIEEFKNDLEKSILGTVTVGDVKKGHELSVDGQTITIKHTK